MSSINSDSSDEGAPIFPETYEENIDTLPIKHLQIHNEIVRKIILLGIDPPFYSNLLNNNEINFTLTCSIYRIYYLITRFFSLKYPGSECHFIDNDCLFYIIFSKNSGISNLKINIFRKSDEIDDTYNIIMIFQQDTGKNDYTIINDFKEVLIHDYNA